MKETTKRLAADADGLASPKSNKMLKFDDTNESAHASDEQIKHLVHINLKSPIPYFLRDYNTELWKNIIADAHTQWLHGISSPIFVTRKGTSIDACSQIVKMLIDKFISKINSAPLPPPHQEDQEAAASAKKNKPSVVLVIGSEITGEPLSILIDDFETLFEKEKEKNNLKSRDIKNKTLNKTFKEYQANDECKAFFLEKIFSRVNEMNEEQESAAADTAAYDNSQLSLKKIGSFVEFMCKMLKDNLKIRDMSRLSNSIFNFVNLPETHETFLSAIRTSIDFYETIENDVPTDWKYGVKENHPPLPLKGLVLAIGTTERDWNFLMENHLFEFEENGGPACTTLIVVENTLDSPKPFYERLATQNRIKHLPSIFHIRTEPSQFFDSMLATIPLEYDEERGSSQNS